MKIISVMLCLLLCLHGAFAAEPSAIREVRLTERILVLQRGPWNDMMTFLDAGQSLVVVDTWSSPDAAREGRQIAERIFKKKTGHVINTHHHWDHIFGNQAFEDALIIGQSGVPAALQSEYGTAEALRKAMASIQSIDASQAGQAYTQAVANEATAHLRLVPPKRLVDREETLQVGDLKIGLLPMPGVHTQTYMLVHVPELGLLVAPKELGLDRKPTPEPGADPDRISAQLEKLMASGPKLQWALLGHFNPIPKPDLGATLEAWRRLKTSH